ncbi:hypothetical protein NKI09_30415 [Mesorhizobium sp. M0757]
MVNADDVVLLSNVDGLLSQNPHNNPAARLVTEVRCITPEIEAMAGRRTPGSPQFGWHGDKVMAARIATDAGCEMVIASGNKCYPLAAIENRGPSTWFFPLAKAGECTMSANLPGNCSTRSSEQP